MERQERCIPSAIFKADHGVAGLLSCMRKTTITCLRFVDEYLLPISHISYNVFLRRDCQTKFSKYLNQISIFLSTFYSPPLYNQ